jgi:glycosyltransferase involved in cell wall biosynthesis
MRILFAHNRYQQRGGEDTVFENEVRMLAASGHDVDALVVSNDAIVSFFDKALTALRTAKNPAGTAAMALAINRFRPDIVHVHNFFPLLSPAIYQICRRAEIPVVQTLHNYRAICAAGHFLRNGQVCNLCLRGSPIWGVVHRCYRGSIIGSVGTVRMIALHNRLGTWRNDVDRFVVLSEFGRHIFIEAGFPDERIDVKPNFMEDPGEPLDIARSGVLFVGRLSKEKGVDALIKASMRFDFPLRIAGSGSELGLLRGQAGPNVTFLGELSRDAVLDEMRRAAAVAVPSLWYEGFPMVVLEAFACATPVIASRIGALAEIVEHAKTGFLASAADSTELGESAVKILNEPEMSRHLGRSARQTFLNRYTPRINLQMIEAIYHRAINQSYKTRARTVAAKWT